MWVCSAQPDACLSVRLGRLGGLGRVGRVLRLIQFDGFSKISRLGRLSGLGRVDRILRLRQLDGLNRLSRCGILRRSDSLAVRDWLSQQGRLGIVGGLRGRLNEGARDIDGLASWVLRRQDSRPGESVVVVIADVSPADEPVFDVSKKPWSANIITAVIVHPFSLLGTGDRKRVGASGTYQLYILRGSGVVGRSYGSWILSSPKATRKSLPSSSKPTVVTS